MIKNYPFYYLLFIFILFAKVSFAQDGTIDPTFMPGTGANSYVYEVSLQQDGKILLCGSFQFFNSNPRNRITRLNDNGTPDLTFAVGNGANDVVQNVLEQPDGKIIISGFFTTYQGTFRSRIARLNTDGSLDTTFLPGTGANNSILHTALLPDGKILIGGFFNTFNGIDRVRIARLNADGSVDTTFNPGNGPQPNLTGGVYSIVPLPDGKIMIAGGFTSFDGTPINRIARLNADGTLDTTFNPGTGIDNNTVLHIELQPDGKMLLTGTFTSYQGVSRNRIVRIHPNGDLDTTFIPGTGANNMIQVATLQTDGKIMIGGNFTTFNGEPANYLARLHADGSRDTSLIVGSGPNDIVRSITLQPDGKILMAGHFTNYNGTNRNRIARLNNACSIVQTEVVNTCGQFTWINGITYTESNDTATYVISSSTGCDTVLQLHLTIEHVTTIDSITACSNYTWIDGVTYTESNSEASFVLTNTAGCDSTVYLNLSIIESDTAVDSINACGDFTWIDGVNYTESNTEASIVLTNTAGCDSIISLSLLIYDLPNPVIEPVDSYTLSTGIFTSYQWYYEDEEIPGANEQSFVATEEGLYSVYVENEFGCGQMSQSFFLLFGNTLNHPFELVKIYPIPADNVLNVSGILPGDLITIKDVLGRTVITTVADTENQQLSVATLPGGTYFIQLQRAHTFLRFTAAFVK